jgi:hypothetical protein
LAYAAAQDLAEWTSPYAALADTDEDYVPFIKEPEDVITRMPELYPRLLQQTWQTLWPSREVQQEKIDGWAEHELQHGRACLTVNPLAAVFYGVKLKRLQHPDGQVYPRLAPFMAVDGSLRKIDMAFIAVAPTKLSSSDLQVVRSLGYESPEEVRQRHAELPSEYAWAARLLDA